MEKFKKNLYKSKKKGPAKKSLRLKTVFYIMEAENKNCGGYHVLYCIYGWMFEFARQNPA